MTSHLSPALARALDDVEHAPGSLRARVGGIDLTADSARDLRQLISGHLYNHWHTRLGERESSARFYRDAAAETRLAAATPVRTTRRSALLLPQIPPPPPGRDTVVVLLDGVRVAVPAADVQDPAGADAPDDRPRPVTVTVPAARTSLSPGFWLVDGSLGRFPSRRPPVRVYLSLPGQDAAPDVWTAVLTTLEAGGRHYRAKIGSSARLYPRTDACVVYLDPAEADGGAVDDLVAALDGHPGLQPTTSVFTRVLSPGIGTAHEPTDPRPGMTGMSFGEHRCYAVATGLLDGHGPADPRERVARALIAASIDPSDPSRNLAAADAPSDRPRPTPTDPAESRPA